MLIARAALYQKGVTLYLVPTSDSHDESGRQRCDILRLKAGVLLSAVISM